jgi:hypothetical protein
LEVYLHGLGYSVHFLSEVRHVARGLLCGVLVLRLLLGGMGGMGVAVGVCNLSTALRALVRWGWTSSSTGFCRRST